MAINGYGRVVEAVELTLNVLGVIVLNPVEAL
jgi:hypothetical protein